MPYQVLWDASEVIYLPGGLGQPELHQCSNISSADLPTSDTFP